MKFIVMSFVDAMVDGSVWERSVSARTLQEAAENQRNRGRMRVVNRIGGVVEC
jgi:hypothetical protein